MKISIIPCRSSPFALWRVVNRRLRFGPSHCCRGQCGLRLAQKLDVPRRISAIGSVRAMCEVGVKSQVDGMISEDSVPAPNHVARSASRWWAD